MAAIQTFVRGALRVVVAQICHNMGWHVVQTTPMELLVDILHRYLEELGRTAHRYSEQFGRTEPNLDDVGLAFKDIGIPMGELEDFINNVEPFPLVQEIAKFPLDRPNNLKFPKPGSRKVQQRPEWIDEHLPLMYPEVEDEEGSPSPASFSEGFGHKSCLDNVLGVDGLSQGLKRPLEIGSACGTFKRSRLFADDEGCPMREGISVFMTQTGEISPVCEGRIPEARAPTFYDEERPSSPPYSGADFAEQAGPPLKEAKKDEKKVRDKTRKEKGKLLKKKNGKKDKDKVVKDGSKKTKDKDKTKSSKDKKLKVVPSVKLTNVDRGPDGKFKKMKSSKMKLPKSKHSTLKPFISKSKVKGGDKSIVSSKANKVRKKIKKLHRPTVQLMFSPKFPKSPKSPKTMKSPVQPKVPRIEKHSSPLAQLASFLNNSANQKDAVDSRSSPENMEVPSVHSEPSDGLSGIDSPKSLVIDDNPERAEKQELEFRMAALNESIDAAIQRGLEETEKQHQESSRSYHDTIEDVIRQGVEASVKTEPRDVYDFTDDETSPPTTPATPCIAAAEGVTVSPPKKKQRRDSMEVGKKVRDKIKEKIKQKSKESRPKIRLGIANIKQDPLEFVDERPKTPEVHHHLPIPEQEPCVSFQAPFPQMLSRFSHLPYFGQIPQVPPALLPYPTPPALPSLPLQFQSHTPPNMPMPPVGFYVRSPKPDAGNLRISDPLLNPNAHLLPSTLPTPPTVVGLSHPPEKDEELPKVKVECADEVDKPKPKEHKKEKKEKVKEKEREKEKERDIVENECEKEVEKVKSKKKKERVKEKKKSSDADSDKGQTKSKSTSKPVKGKDKGKEKKSEKEKKKKEEKVKDESNNSAIPRITLKLGGNAATTEGAKIVLKLKLPKPTNLPCSPLACSLPEYLNRQSSAPTSKLNANNSAEYDSDSSNSSVQPSLNPNYDTDSSVPSSDCLSGSLDSNAQSPLAVLALPQPESCEPEAEVQLTDCQKPVADPLVIATDVMATNVQDEDCEFVLNSPLLPSPDSSFALNPTLALDAPHLLLLALSLDSQCVEPSPLSPLHLAINPDTLVSDDTLFATSNLEQRVIKPLTARESTQSSDSSSPVADVVATTPKAHPKPQSKVNPVPLPAKPPAVVPPIPAPSASTPARTVITETVGTIIDDQGNKIWICPACTRPDDGSAMIGCDECDDWYHWVCVDIVVPPKEEENWFCKRCIAKKQCTQKKKKKKHRKDKNAAMN